jgi:hypothetical protein
MNIEIMAPKIATNSPAANDFLTRVSVWLSSPLLGHNVGMGYLFDREACGKSKDYLCSCRTQ